MHAADDRILIKALHCTVIICAFSIAQCNRLTGTQTKHTASMMRVLALQNQHAVFRLPVHKKSWHDDKMNLSYSIKKPAVWQVNIP